MNGLQCPQQGLLWRWKQHGAAVTPVTRITMETSTLTKQGQRFLTKLTTSAAAADNLIRRFVQGSPKSVVLTTLSHLLSPSTSHPHLSSIALPLYGRATQAPWFTWNSTTVAELAALLHELGHRAQSEALISEAISKLQSRHRDLVVFYGRLAQAHSKRKSETGFDAAHGYLDDVLRTSESAHVKRRAYEFMVSGLCCMDRPGEAEELVIGAEDGLGLKPSGFELKSIVHGYGRLGLFGDMRRVVEEMEKRGFVLDTVCCNMVVSAYGVHGEHAEMVRWLRRMRDLGVPFSVRTYNSVSNCCPRVLRMVGGMSELALSIEELEEGLEGGEGMVVRELLGCGGILEEVMVWETAEVKVDLHGFHLGGAYLVVLVWLEEMWRRLNGLSCGVPAEVTVVCGLGNHSRVFGESKVRVLVQKMMVKMGSPLKVDRKNNGCFVAKGKAVQNWLCQMKKAQSASM
ncbi:hypothetical protein PHAVU_007G017200 [Phaseolus vulgaris]|uniref:Smr domain-containing protein n=1 Tax=Phaseolus vulgaris TaxID=3885 RepID=V7BE93_PHAVU|nr:hypothetical protein PHAVU_007G017200g [Phaseolus vulgaris]ESW14786.1 hypothetical protein PHAVU_007G017200g [Phaseolus vulgaris]